MAHFAAAEGFLHDFEGWIIFMACVAVLFVEIWLLNLVTRRKTPLRELFNLTLPKVPMTSVRAAASSFRAVSSARYPTDFT